MVSRLPLLVPSPPCHLSSPLRLSLTSKTAGVHPWWKNAKHSETDVTKIHNYRPDENVFTLLAKSQPNNCFDFYYNLLTPKSCIDFLETVQQRSRGEKATDSVDCVRMNGASL